MTEKGINQCILVVYSQKIKNYEGNKISVCFFSYY